METFVKVIISVFLVGMVVMVIVFFTLFGLVPAEKLTKVLKGEKLNSTSGEPIVYVTTTTVVERIVEKEVKEVEKEGEFPVFQKPKPEPEPKPKPEPEPEPKPEPESPTPPPVEIRLDVDPGAYNAPKQSEPLSERDLPKDAVLLEIKAGSIKPGNFTVNTGEEITLAVGSFDNYTHIFKFKSPNLSAIAIGVGPGEIRSITFDVPEPGIYEFYCDVPGHEERGETGNMQVR